MLPEPEELYEAAQMRVEELEAENERLQRMLDVCSSVHAHNVKLVAERDRLAKVARCADQLTDRLAEFGGQKINGECLCKACAEYVQHLDDAIDEWKRARAVLEKGK